MEFYTLASSSSGNASLLIEKGTYLLIDAGVSARRIAAELRKLSLHPERLDAVLLTHAHSDHVKGLHILRKQTSLPVYASRGTWYDMDMGAKRPYYFVPGDSFSIGDLEIHSFRTSHDALDSVGYRIDSMSNSVGFLTDTGFVTEEAKDTLCGVDFLLLESNYDEQMLACSAYPSYVKERIRSKWGHLSNQQAAEFAHYAAEHGTSHILLAHLSQENNLPELALSAVSAHLGEYQVQLSVAPAQGLYGGSLCEKLAFCALEN